MDKAQEGNTVSVNYIGIFENGKIFHQCDSESPLQFTIGSHQLLPDFEQAVVGMELGETKQVTIESNKAYGEYTKENVAVINRDKLPDSVELSIGQELKAQDENGNTIFVSITDFNDTTVTIDANHPLAGRNLIFEITLTEILDT